MALLGIARTILRKGLTFRSNVELVAFAGEEQGKIADDIEQIYLLTIDPSFAWMQGLLGSKAYSRM
jgi:hypothetical protein